MPFQFHATAEYLGMYNTLQISVNFHSEPTRFQM
jgi:hypothetical protein